MNQPLKTDQDNNEITDSNSANSDSNINKLATTTSIDDLTKGVGDLYLGEEYQTTNMYYEDFDDGDDEVFVEYEENIKSVTRAGREPRIRRISDVIDSIGETSPSPSTKDRSNSFSFSDQTFAQVEEKSLVIVRREEIKHFHLEKPPKSTTAMDSPKFPMSPPATPGSDVGYYSTGAPTPPSAYAFRPNWFRYSNPNVDAVSPPKDTWDAIGFLPPFQQQAGVPQELKPSTSSVPVAAMPVAKDSIEYNMNHPQRGHALIFNHEDFTMENFPPRKGSHLDAARLQTTLTALGFIVQVFNDLTCENIKTKLAHVASLDHSECDCVMVVVLSHGLKSNFILSYDYPYPVDMLWSPFVPDKCPSLAGKPKLFFIQACRGEKLDGGVKIMNRTQTDSGSGDAYKIPGMADFLLAFSTVEGFYSWRNPENGTWFIQSLCQVLEEEGIKQELSTILLTVSRKVALDYESYNDLYPWQHEQKQVPQIVSTLIRQMYFKPKH